MEPPSKRPRASSRDEHGFPLPPGSPLPPPGRPCWAQDLDSVAQQLQGELRGALEGALAGVDGGGGEEGAGELSAGADCDGGSQGGAPSKDAATTQEVDEEGEEDEDTLYEEAVAATASPSGSGGGAVASPDLSLQSEVVQLRLQVAQLRAHNRTLAAENLEFRKRTAVLSPALYTVHAPKEVRRNRLGRTASISTTNELNRLSRGNSVSHSLEEADLLDRVAALIRPGCMAQEQRWLHSLGFADALLELCARVSRVFSAEPRVLALQSPMYIFGDLHGNFQDLQFFAEHVWPMGVRLSAGKLLFLGDYVDRGSLGLELLAYLFAQKVSNPDKVFMIRGNHETRSVNGWEAFYGPGSFIAQCKARFGAHKGFEVWERCNKAFDCMPLASIVDNSIFCVHGGIPSPIDNPKGGKKLMSLAELRNATPPTPAAAAAAASLPDTRIEAMRRLPCPLDIQPPQPGVTDAHNELAFSLLWADPADPEQESVLERCSETGFGESARGGGTVIFGNRAVHNFLARNGLNYVIRAHEATANGVAVCKSAKVLTVFSTSKDHGCGGDAKCGCFLVDRSRIQAITRSATYGSGMGEGDPVEQLPAAAAETF
jgi:diadenosine tetraphosphatase ApaH/serine/threonine PP2A family protein phosphatase